MNAPSFTAVICNYNYAQFVGAAIDSALQQNYPFELLNVIVVDDGSTDDSRNVFKAYAKEPRVRVITQENRGQSAAFAAGVAAATGDYVCLLDSDDRFLPSKISQIAKFITALNVPSDDLFLCHDLEIENLVESNVVNKSWFDIVGVTQLGASLTVNEAMQWFPFSIPCGLVFGRALITLFYEALPAWAFARGADGVLCPAAFLKTGTVHYLKEKLGVYRVHGGNEFATVSDGRFMPRFNWRVRTPKTLRFLEQWLDSLDFSPTERASRLGYLKRIEHFGRRPSASRNLNEPLVTIAILASSLQIGTALESAVSQSYVHVEILVPKHAALDASTTLPKGVRYYNDDSSASDLSRLAAAYREAKGAYIIFLRAGDVLDREFVERHIFLRQMGLIIGVSCSDIRLIDPEHTLIHTDAFANSGAWKQPLQQIPPLTATLKDWVGVPISACMFRCTAFLDQLVARLDSIPQALQISGYWLLFQLLLHSAGALRIRETLSSIVVTDGAGASYGYLAAASTLHGELVQPPISIAAEWLREFYAEQQPLFNHWLPATWHARFTPWLDAQIRAQ